MISELNKSLAEYQSQSAVRRAGAFTDCPEYVLGRACRPVTPLSYRLLQATDSAFLRGDTALEGDVRNFIWFHSRWFTTSRLLARPARWFALLPFSALLHAKPGLNHYAAVIALASNDIERILADSFADVPAPDNVSAGMPAGACIEAQLIHLFFKSYGWPASRTRKTPLRQLFQYMRCIAPGDDRGAQAIKAAYLKSRNAARLAQQ